MSIGSTDFEALLQEAVQALLQGAIDDGRATLRAYINATIGFERLGKVLGRQQNSLMRMFGPSGIPTAENLLGVIQALQREGRASRNLCCYRGGVTDWATVKLQIFRNALVILFESNCNAAKSDPMKTANR